MVIVRRVSYDDIKRRQRQRQQRVAGFVALVLLAIFSLGLLTSCGPGRVELDPRDEMTLEEYEDEFGCDRNSASVDLKIWNRGSASVEVWLYSRAGARRHIGIISGFEKKLKRVSRSELEVGGTFLLRQASGLTLGDGEFQVPIGLLSCDTGYLELGASVAFSQYLGMDFHPDVTFKR